MRAAVDIVGRQCWPRALKTAKSSFVECVPLVTLDEGAFDLTEIKPVATMRTTVVENGLCNSI